MTSIPTNNPYLIFHIIEDSSYPVIDPAYIEIGKTFLQAVLKKIAFLKFNLHYVVHNINWLALKKPLKYLTGIQDDMEITGKCEKLWMFMAEMVLYQKFELLYLIQEELSTLLQQVFQNQPLINIDESMIFNPNSHLVASLNQSMIDTINLIDEDPQVLPQVHSETVLLQEIDEQIDEYLKKITNYRSELNFLSQMMKIPTVKIETNRESNYYEVKCSLCFECIYLNKKIVYIQGTSIHSYYEDSLQASCSKLLRKIYTSVPEMWKDFSKLKQKKAIVT